MAKQLLGMTELVFFFFFFFFLLFDMLKGGG